MYFALARTELILSKTTAGSPLRMRSLAKAPCGKSAVLTIVVQEKSEPPMHMYLLGCTTSACCTWWAGPLKLPRYTWPGDAWRVSAGVGSPPSQNRIPTRSRDSASQNVRIATPVRGGSARSPKKASVKHPSNTIQRNREAALRDCITQPSIRIMPQPS